MGGGPWWLYTNRPYGLGMFWGRCFRFPWLPRWWWMSPNIDSEDERKMIAEELKLLQEEMERLQKRLQELEETES